MTQPIPLSRRAIDSPPAPISYLIAQGVGNPNLISLAAGLVDQESLPCEEIANALQDVLSRPAQLREALQYGTTAGLAPLREEIRRRWALADGANPDSVDLARVFLGTGSQQLLYLLAEILLDPGDIVLAGVPAYFVYLGALESFGTRIVSVRTDENGLDPKHLEEQLADLERAGQLSRVKFVYDVSYFNNPTGWTLSADRRSQVVDIVRRWSTKQRILLVEDAAYRELRYGGQDLPSLLAHDPAGDYVVYTGTFSKPFAPGVRTGFGIFPADLVEPLTTQKGHHDFGSASLNQHLLLSVLTSGAYERHLAKLRQVYAEKMQTFLDILERQLAGNDALTWTRPQGGLYVWLRLPESVSTDIGSDLFKECLANGVLYVPGRFCYPARQESVPTHHLRLSFGHPSRSICEEGMQRICRVLEKHLAHASSRSFA